MDRRSRILSQGEGRPWRSVHYRGFAHRTDGQQDHRLLLGTLDGRLIALDPRMGASIRSFGDQGEIDLEKGLDRVSEEDRHGLTSPPVVVGDVVMVGSPISDAQPKKFNPRGDVRGFDVERCASVGFSLHSGRRRSGAETWENGSHKHTGNTNVWTVMSGDEELGFVYLPFSTPTNDWYGGHRHGDNLYAESLVCLNAASGRRVWHFQMVRHGLWDYDLPAAPNLVEHHR